MNENERLRAITITKDVKAGVRGMLDKYAAEISQINKANDDPHTPVIGCMQMALAQAAVEFLVTSGCKPNEAVQLTCDTTNNAMQQWLNSILKPVEKKSKIIR